MPRSMTAAEKRRFSGYFPRLNVNRAVVTGNATRVYNCISWTVGVTSRWIWPGSSIRNFDSFYTRYNLVRASNGHIAAWGQSTSSMTHACISGRGHGPRWESKCGSDLRIQHGLNELVSSSYGRVVAFYRQRTPLTFDKEAEKFLSTFQEEGRVRISVTKAERTALRAATRAVPANARKRFDELFVAWKKSWSAPHAQLFSDPGFVRFSPEFHNLVALGAETIPLVVDRLVDTDNFFALQLYDVLQPESSLTVQLDEDDELIVEGEQGRAARTVKLYLSNF